MFASVRLHYHLIVSTSIALAISAVLLRIDFLEWWYGLSRVHAGWQLDGMLCVLIGGLAGGLWFTSRRRSAPANLAATPFDESRALAESEARYRQFVEGGMRSVVIERDFELLYANPAAAELLGYDSPEQLVALGDVRKLVTPRDVAKLKKGHRKPGKGQTRIPLQKLECIRKNGARVTMDGASRPMVWEGRPAVMHSFFDFTEKRLAEESLRASQRLLQTVVDNLPVGVFVYDRERRFVFANKAMGELSGIRPEDYPGKSVTDLGIGTKAELKRLEETDRKVLKKGLRMDMPEEAITYPDGRVAWRRVIKAPLYGDDGAIAGIVGVREDITERKQAEQELGESREAERKAHARLIDAIESIPASFTLYDKEQRFVLGNNRVRELFPELAPMFRPGTPYEDILRWGVEKDLLRINTEDKEGEVRKRVRAHRMKKAEYEEAYSDGRWFAVYHRATSDGGTVTIRLDITGRKRVEQELRESREALDKAHTRLSEAIESLPVSFALYDEEDRFVLCNSKTREMFPEHGPILVPGTPYADVVRLSIAKGLMKLDPQKAEAMILERASEHHTRQDVIEQEFADGRWFEVYHRPTSEGGIVTIRMDITARKRTEQELRDSQRLLQTVFDTIPQQLSIKDLEGRYLKVNKAWCDTFGLSEQEVINKLPSALSSRPAEDTAEVMKEDRSVLKAKGGGKFYEDYRTVAGGEKRLFQFSKAPIQDEHGQIVGITSVGLDITELKRTEQELRASQRLLQTVFDTIPHVLAIKDREGRYLKVNKAWCDTYGLTGEEVLNKLPSALFSRPDKELAEIEQEDMAAFAAQGEVQYFESRRTDRSGERRLFQGIKAPILDEHDQMVGLATIGLDITELKRAEQELRGSQRLLRTVFDVLPVGVFVKDRERKFIMVNEAFASIYGWKAEKLIGMESADLIQHDAEAFENSVKTDLQVLNEGERAEIDEEQATTMDGRRFWRRAIKVPLWDEEGKVGGIVGIREDISERKRVEQREQSRNEVLELLATEAPLSEVLERIVRVSESLYPETLCSVLLLDEENKCLRLGAAPSLPEFYNQAIDGMDLSYGSGSPGTAAETGERLVVDDIMTHPFWADLAEVATKAGLKACWSQPIISSGEEILGAFAMYYREAREPAASELEQMKSAAGLAGIAISRARTEDALRGSEERFRSLVDQAVDAFFILDLDGKIMDVNREASESLGYSPDQLLAMRFEDFEQDSEFLTGLEKWKDGGDLSPITLIGTHRRNDGATFPVEVRLGAIEAREGRLLLAVARNQSERIWMEEQVSQAQKMRAIGGLAGGIAHEFNNILTPLIGYTNLVQNRLQPDSEEFKDLAIVKKAANRARDLVAQILLFSRKKEGERKPLQLDLVAKEVLVLLGSVLPKSVVIAQRIAPDLSLVFADATQMHILLMNLCANANQAMPGGGVLQVNLENVRLDRFEITPKQHVSGNFVHLMVKDSGVGMDEETVARAFDPFFTTKPLGEGTGMGLSSVYGIVKIHDGHIMLSSKVGGGTIFHVYLPIIDTAPAAPAERAEPVSAGRESILFVDDEEDIMQMGKFGLEKLGYRVTAVTNPLDALELFRKNPKGFDLIATDQIMPEMNGDRLIAEIRHIRADIPVIVSTGFDDQFTEGKLDAQGIDKLVIKPFGYEEFGQIIREVLDTRAAPEITQGPPPPRGETAVAHPELAEANRALEELPGGNVPVDLSGKRINTAGTDDNLIIEISGNQPLSEEEKQYLLSLYAQAKRDQKNTIVQCESGLYEFLRATGFDKFLELTVLQ